MGSSVSVEVNSAYCHMYKYSNETTGVWLLYISKSTAP